MPPKAAAKESASMHCDQLRGDGAERTGKRTRKVGLPLSSEKAPTEAGVNHSGGERPLLGMEKK